MNHDETGLSQKEAERLLATEGPNELPDSRRRGVLAIAWDVLAEPMFALLLAGGLVYLLLGDTAEAIILICFATFSIFITVFQESRTERVLDALRDLTSPRALVIRDGAERRIPGREVVRGDVMILAEGDRVPADAALVEATDLMVDESLLTGESVPVAKGHEAEGDKAALVHAGSLVVRGRAIVRTTATGSHSEIGKIGKSLAGLDLEPPRLRVQTRRMVKTFAVIGGVASLLAVLLYGFLRGDWLGGLLAGIALGMSMMPEEFPVILTVFMAMGAWRIARANVLTRRTQAIETLGAATILCTDKTGTLTENKMSIAALALPDGQIWRAPIGDAIALPDPFRALVLAGMQACPVAPFDPMEKAFLGFGSENGFALAADSRIIRHYGLRKDMLAVTQVWQDADGRRLVATKGAPETIARLCGLEPTAIAGLSAQVNSMAEDGLRVLGVAVAEAGPEMADLPDEITAYRFSMLGLVGLADRIRASVPAAIASCRSAGIRVVMITGDYPATARAIADQAGLAAGGILTGTEIAALDDAALKARLADVNVFARIMPDQKLRLVQLFKEMGEIVAMTGDGVNDAPSIKAAHIGIAMGGRGTDVAREASSLVLLDDDFGSIVKAIRLGRRIYDNILKAMGFVLAVHVPIAGISLLPVMLGLPPMFLPMHIAILEMIIDPVCSLVFEAETEERQVMERPPRAPDAALFSTGRLIWSLTQGMSALAVVLALLAGGLKAGMPEDEIRSLVFVGTVATVVALIFVNRSFSTSLWRAVARPNPMFYPVLMVVAVLVSSLTMLPFAANLFRFGPLHGPDVLLAIGACLVLLVTLEVMKRISKPWIS